MLPCPRKAISSAVSIALALAVAGCPDKPEAAAVDAAPAPALRAEPSALPVATVDAAIVPAPIDAGRDAAEPRRFDPKYKCPTGQTHFYLEGDFCRKKCFSASDCGRGERCSAMEYPFLVDGGPGGTGHFCEM